MHSSGANPRDSLIRLPTALTLVDPVVVIGVGTLALGITDLSVLVVSALTSVLGFQTFGLHRSRLVLSVVEDVPRLALGSLVCGLVLFGASTVLDAPLDVGPGTYALSVVLLMVGLVVLRTLVYAVTNTLRRRGYAAHPVIIVGAGSVGIRLANALIERPEHGLVPVGFVDEEVSDARSLPIPLLGGIRDLDQAMVNLGVGDVVFSFAEPPDRLMVNAVQRSIAHDHQVFVVPRFHELMHRDSNQRLEVVHGVALVRLHRWAWRPASMMVKRGADVAISAVALAMLAPLLAFIAVFLRLETRAGLIFRQTRVGQGGRNFQLFKFQTMRPVSGSDVAWSVDNDDRIGTFGLFLRRTGLDELPQLVNVLRGDMSLVGPRPERPHFVEQFTQQDSAYARRHRVRAGITGWAQINNLRGDTSITERAIFDNDYIENWSLWSDVKIMVRTLPTFARSQPRGRDIIESIAAAPPAAVGTTDPAPAQQ